MTHQVALFIALDIDLNQVTSGWSELIRARILFAINEFSPWDEPMTNTPALYAALDEADKLVKEAYRINLVGSDRKSFLRLVYLVFFIRTFLGCPVDTISLYMPNGNSIQGLVNVISVICFSTSLFDISLFNRWNFSWMLLCFTGAFIGIQDKLSSILIRRLFEQAHRNCASSPLTYDFVDGIDMCNISFTQTGLNVRIQATLRRLFPT